MTSDNTTSTTPGRKPILWFDGNCAFCRDQVDRLLYLCGWRADASPLQSNLPPGTLPEEVKLQMPDGQLYGGAQAVFRTLALSPLFRPLYWIYLIPGIRQILDAGYRIIAANRYNHAISACPTGSCGVHPAHPGGTASAATPGLRDHPTWRRSAKLFWVLFCLLYAMSFINLYVQVIPLNGADGLAPAAERLAAVKTNTPTGPSADWRTRFYVQIPSLLWLDSSDRALRAGCLIGVAAAILAMLGILRRTMLVIMGALYLSYVSAGGVFYRFQWDNLQLEMTLHALLLPTYGIVLLFRAPRRRFARRYKPPHPIVVFLMLWLLFRVYFESGLAKVLQPDGGWRDLTAMQHYYDTAPLATWLGWKAHNLPAWWHQIETALVLVIELVLPVFIFSRRWARGCLFVVFTAFQLAILLTANYGLFNYLTLILGLFLLDDRHYEPLFRLGRRVRASWFKARAAAAAQRTRNLVYVPSITGSLARTVVLLVFATGIFAASLVEMSSLFLTPRTRQRLLVWSHLPRIERTDQPTTEMTAGQRCLDLLADACFIYKRARLVNNYHLFAYMTRTRSVPQFQGLTEDGRWVFYPYRYAPANPQTAPRICAPYHPRLDFQVWFAGMNRRFPQRLGYLRRLVDRLAHDPAVASRYFATDPFATSPPTKIRVVLTRYRMSDRDSFDRVGWWVREPAGILIPAVDVQIPTRSEAADTAPVATPTPTATPTATAGPTATSKPTTAAAANSRTAPPERADKPPPDDATSNGAPSPPKDPHR